MSSLPFKLRLLAAACVSPLVLMNGPAFAQDAGAGTAAADDQAQEADDSPVQITVFAQRRAEKLQDVPIQVSAFNSQILADAGVKDIKELTVLTPGLLVTSTTSETVTTARIRGVGTVGDNPGLESSVGVIIDGVYRPRNGVGFADLGELERVEVLKGPQGTLFGKNTSAGLIQVFSAKPKFEWGSQGELTIAEQGTFGGSASITGPIIQDKLAFRVYGAVRSRSGLTDVVRGVTPGDRGQLRDQDQQFAGFRGQLLFTPVDNFDLRIIGDYTTRSENCCVAVSLPSLNNTTSGALAANATATAIDALAGGNGTAVRAGSRLLDPGFDTFDRRAFANRGTEQFIVDYGISGEANWDIGKTKLIALLAYRNWNFNGAGDFDFTTADIFYRNGDGTNGNSFKTFSAELRAQGSLFGDRFRWTTGGFYANEKLQRRDSFLAGAQTDSYLGLLASGGTSVNGLFPITGRANGTNFAAGNGTRDVYNQTTNSYALFGQSDWKVIEKITLTTGIRWTSDNKDLNNNYRQTDGGIACRSAQTRLASGLLGRPPSAAAQGAVGLLCLTFFNFAFDGVNITDQRTDNEITGVGKISFKPTENFLFYGGYSRGFKAGGFNLDREQTATLAVDRDTSFLQETVNAYEIGTKTTWLQESLRFNITGFWNTFQNFQLNTFLGTSFVVQTIPEVTSRGFDVDSLWVTPFKGLVFQGGFTYSNTRYRNIFGSTTSLGSLFLDGQRLSFAPKLSSSFGFSYTKTLADTVKFRFSLNGRYTTRYSTASDLLPAKDQEAFTLFNGRFGISTPNERVSLEFFGNNLFNKDYIQVGFNGPLQGNVTSALTRPGGTGPVLYNPNADTISYYAFLAPQRIAGLSLKFKY